MRTFTKLVLIPPLILLIALPIASAQESEQAFSEAELDQMLAPVALYPDALLSQILMASTYPLEVVEASRWSRNNPGLEGAQAVEAVADKDWDPSVKALIAFPQVLARMDEDLEWTRRLGDAFLSQKAEVMDRIQELRERAYAAGTLETLEHLRVHREGGVIVIEPASPHIVYVPTYYPQVIYGSWWWPAYPPVFWGPPPGYYASTLFIWSSGIRVSSGFFFSAFDWPRRHVVIVNIHKHPPTPHFTSRTIIARHGGFHQWRHDPKHRRGVVYRHETLRRRFGRSSASGLVKDKVFEPQGSRNKPHASHERHGSVSRSSSRRASSISRTDDRPTGPSAVIRRRNNTRSGANRTSNITRPGIPSPIRSHTLRSGTDRDATRGYRRDSDAHESGVRRGPAQRPEAGAATIQRSGSSHTHARRPSVHRPTSQRRETVRRPGPENSRAARTENRASSGDRRAHIESSGSASSRNRGYGRATSDRRQGFRPGGNPIQSPAGRARGGAFSR